MTAEEIRSHIKGRPFHPFKLCLADGRQVPVIHHDFIMLSPNERLAHVYQSDNSCSIVDVMLVLSIELSGGSEAQPNPSANGT